MGKADATLLGRQTYDEFASYWPSADPADPFTQAMNGARKYVVSSTLENSSGRTPASSTRARRVTWWPS